MSTALWFFSSTTTSERRGLSPSYKMQRSTTSSFSFCSCPTYRYLLLLLQHPSWSAHFIMIITKNNNNIVCSCIAAMHWSFNCIRQVAPVFAPHFTHGLLDPHEFAPIPSKMASCLFLQALLCAFQTDLRTCIVCSNRLRLCDACCAA